VFIDDFVHQLPDIDPAETQEWLESLQSVVDARGKSRATYLLSRLMEQARAQGVGVPAVASTPYINTIPPEREPWFPGDEHLERRIRAFVRWNAAVMVARANRRHDGLGGHLSTYASAAALYEVGFNHFFHGKDDGRFGDQVFMQGHAAPGIYARAFLEGRGAPRPVPSGSRRRRSPELPAPSPDARLLGVPDRVDGARPAERGRPGPLQPVPPAPRDGRHERVTRLVLHRRRGDGRARVAGCAVARGT
jgi:hypothetical protein